MKNPALKIWLEGQVIYATLNGIALLVIITLAVVYRTSDIALLGGFCIVIGFASELLFAMPAIILLAHWLRFLRSYCLNKLSCMIWSVVGFSIFMYFCATLLWFTLTGSLIALSSNTGGFYLFTGAAIVSAMISMVMNYRSLYRYLRPCDYADPVAKETNYTPITSQTDNNES